MWFVVFNYFVTYTLIWIIIIYFIKITLYDAVFIFCFCVLYYSCCLKQSEQVEGKVVPIQIKWITETELKFEVELKVLNQYLI